MSKDKIPTKGKSTGRKPIYDFGSMLVGQCMLIKPSGKTKATQAAYGYGKRTGKKFVQRKGGLEIWREA
jgi:hypothetical protein